MAILKKTYRFKKDKKTIWNLMTDIKDQQWRSNLTNIEVFDDGSRFIENSLDGYATEYQVKIFEPYNRLEIKIENDSIEGSYLIIFSDMDEEVDKGTEITFVYDVEAKNVVQKPFVKNYVETQMTVYIKDLCAALGEEVENLETANPYSGFNNLSLGVVIGLMIGMVIDNYAIGICIGVATGVGLNMVRK